MNIAVVFAGGTGQRMGSQPCPKQFLKVHGKPIIAYTLEQFQQNRNVHGIVISCVENYLNVCVEIVQQYHFDKVDAMVPGGATGQESIYHGLKKASELYGNHHIVLVHDGVRPLIDQDTINRAIACTEINRSAITVAPAVETVTLKNQEGMIESILDRSRCTLAKAPQCFFLEDILAAHEKARVEGRNDFIDSAMLMSHYGYMLYTVEGNRENIKITTPIDYYIFKAILDSTGKIERDCDE